MGGSVVAGAIWILGCILRDSKVDVNGGVSRGPSRVGCLQIVKDETSSEGRGWRAAVMAAVDEENGRVTTGRGGYLRRGELGRARRTSKLAAWPYWE